MSYIIYGSQTGQAESIAESLYENLSPIIENLKICELDEIEKSYEIGNLKVAIVICSTTGDGDAPENASKFVRLLKSSKLSIKNLRYTVLGLGDTNYSNFCYCGKTIDSYLLKNGAIRFYKSDWADDAVGLELVVEPWLDGLYEAVKSLSIEDISVSFEDLKIIQTMNGVNECSGEFENDMTLIQSQELLGDNLVEDIKGKQLNVPLVPPQFLEILYHKDESHIEVKFPLVTKAILPSDKSGLIIANLSNISKITKKYAIKSVHLATIESSETKEWTIQPGDSIGILPQNCTIEVDSILQRLGCSEDVRDCRVSLQIKSDTEKRRAKVPDHLVVDEKDNGRLSVRSMLLWLVDIRQPVSKAGLRILAEYCPPGSASKRRLLEFCSKEGQTLYNKCLREPSMPLLDLLNWFPDCQVPIERLLEVLPRLKPRAYSLCSLNKLQFAFSKVDIAPIQQFRKRPLTGVCTTWMENMIQQSSSGQLISIPIYLRKNMNGFTINKEFIMKPHVFIGPGTGVAPFIGFLEYFKQLKDTGVDIGPIWLFFGCRNKCRDFIFRDQMEYFVKQGILTHVCVALSRDNWDKSIDDNSEQESRSFCMPSNCKYVQHCMMHHQTQLADLVVNQEARVYVCGDENGMSKDVLESWCQIVKGFTSELDTDKAAQSFVTKLRVNKIYLEDVWA